MPHGCSHSRSASRPSSARKRPAGGGEARSGPTTAKRSLNNVDSAFAPFEARSRGLHALCVRFAAGVAPGPRNTRFRLVASLGRAGLSPAESHRWFTVMSFRLHGVLHHQASPGASKDGLASRDARRDFLAFSDPTAHSRSRRRARHRLRAAFGVRPRLIARTRPLTSLTVSPKVSCSGREIRYRSRPADNRLAVGVRHRPGDRLPRRGSHRPGDPGRLAELRMIQPVFSPRGEVKCVRGPSGRGASRAEKKGARNVAFKVFHESRVTNHGLFIACSDRRVVRNAG